MLTRHMFDRYSSHSLVKIALHKTSNVNNNRRQTFLSMVSSHQAAILPSAALVVQEVHSQIDSVHKEDFRVDRDPSQVALPVPSVCLHMVRPQAGSLQVKASTLLRVPSRLTCLLVLLDCRTRTSSHRVREDQRRKDSSPATMKKEHIHNQRSLRQMAHPSRHSPRLVRSLPARLLHRPRSKPHHLLLIRSLMLLLHSHPHILCRL